MARRREGERNTTHIRISLETKARLEGLRVIEEETLDHVIRNLLDQLKGPVQEG